MRSMRRLCSYMEGYTSLGWWGRFPHDLVLVVPSFFFFNDTATTEIYTLSLHDALPIWRYSYAPRLAGSAHACVYGSSVELATVATGATGADRHRPRDRAIRPRPTELREKRRTDRRARRVSLTRVRSCAVPHEHWRRSRAGGAGGTG